MCGLPKVMIIEQILYHVIILKNLEFLGIGNSMHAQWVSFWLKYMTCVCLVKLSNEVNEFPVALVASEIIAKIINNLPTSVFLIRLYS